VRVTPWNWVTTGRFAATGGTSGGRVCEFAAASLAASGEMESG
jgi:hypothetical protein